MVRKLFFLAATTAVISANAQNVIVDGHEAVDLGLSVLWATCNVGAKNPEDAGKYFAWGDTVGYAKGVAHDFDWANYWDAPNNDNITFNIYNHEDGGLTELTAEHDVATQKFGEHWRMPTFEDIQELKNNCQWIGNSAKNGFDIISKTGNNNSIFLPVAGYRDVNGTIKEEDTYGHYWLRSIDEYDNYNAKYLYIKPPFNGNISGRYRCYGLLVRPVCEKSAITSLNYVEKQNSNTVYKTIENGQIVIIKNGVKYNLAGQKLLK